MIYGMVPGMKVLSDIICTSSPDEPIPNARDACLLSMNF